MLSGLRSPLERLVHRLEMRSPLDAHHRDALLGLMTYPRAVKARHRIGDRSDDGDRIQLVASGLVGSYNLARTGSRQMIALHIHGDCVNLASVMLDDDGGVMEAISDAIVVAVPRAELLALADEHPAIAQALWRDCAVDARIAAQWLANIGQKNARSRLAHLICEMACRYEDTGSAVGLGFELPMTQQDMSEILALTSVHLNRVMQTLRGEGIVDVRGRIVELLNWDALVEAADFDAGYLFRTRSVPQ